MADLSKIAEQLRDAPYQLPSDIAGVYAATTDLVDILGRVDHICRELANRVDQWAARDYEVDELGPPGDTGELLDTVSAMLLAAGQKVLDARPDVTGAMNRLSRIRPADPGAPR